MLMKIMKILPNWQLLRKIKKEEKKWEGQLFMIRMLNLRDVKKLLIIIMNRSKNRISKLIHIFFLKSKKLKISINNYLLKKRRREIFHVIKINLFTKIFQDFRCKEISIIHSLKFLFHSNKMF